MHDESVNREQERAFAAFLDRLATGEQGEAGVDPTLAETTRDLHDRAAHSTVSAPPAGTLASIRADLFGEHATHRRDHAALGLVPFPSLLTRPAAQIALTAAILLALVTGVATFRGNGWLAHGPTSTHSALAASSTAPTTTQLAMSPDNGISAETSYGAPGTTASIASSAPALSPEVQSLLQSCPMPRKKQLPPGADASNYTWSVGTSPLWMVAGYSNHDLGLPVDPAKATFNPGFIPGLINPTDYQRYKSGSMTPQGWRMQAFWLLDRSITEPVTVRVQRVSDGAEATVSKEFDPAIYKKIKQTPPATGPMFSGAIVFPGTGCYEMTATWSDGSSTVRFPFVQPADTESASATPVPATPVASPGAATPSSNTTCPMPDAQAITLPITSGQYIRNAWGLGTSPLWLVGLGNTPSWYHPTDPGFVVSGTNGPSEIGGRPGQRITVLWLMDPNHPQPVNVRGKGINDGPDLFFENDANVGGSKEITFTQGGSKGTVYMWWTTIIYTQPGCYELTATWATGSWTIRLPLPPPAATATPAGCATPVPPGTPPVTTHTLSQAPPPFATRQPPIPYITPGIQQIITPPGIPLITPTPFATIIGVATPPGTPPSGCN